MTDNSNNNNSKTILSLSFMMDYTADEPLGLNWSLNPYLTAEDDNDVVEPGKLSDYEHRTLKEKEEGLVECWAIFDAIGMDLHEIKDDKLYRATHPSFAAYCEEKLGLKHMDKRNAALVLIDSEALENEGLTESEIAEVNEATRNLVDKMVKEKRSRPKIDKPALTPTEQHINLVNN